jgi:hypothetical protein
MSQDRISQLQRRYDFIVNNESKFMRAVVGSFVLVNTLLLREYKRNAFMSTYLPFCVGFTGGTAVLLTKNSYEKELNELKEETRQFKLKQLSGKV